MSRLARSQGAVSVAVAAEFIRPVCAGNRRGVAPHNLAMSNKKKEPSGCGCANIPISVILLILGGGYWWFTNQGHLYISKLLPDNLPIAIPGLNLTPTEPPITPTPTLPSSPIVEPNNQPTSQRAQNPPSKVKMTHYQKQ